jgi:hypothetical protein
MLDSQPIVFLCGYGDLVVAKLWTKVISFWARGTETG